MFDDELCGGLWTSSFASVGDSLWSWSCSISFSSLVGHFSVVGLTRVGGLIVGMADADPLPMAMSEQARNSSCSPQPTAPLPSLQIPQLLPATYFHCSTQCWHSSSGRKPMLLKLTSIISTNVLAAELWSHKFSIRFADKTAYPNRMVGRRTAFRWRLAAHSYRDKFDARWCRRRAWTRSSPCDWRSAQLERWRARPDCIFWPSRLVHTFRRTRAVSVSAGRTHHHILRTFLRWSCVDEWNRRKTIRDRCSWLAYWSHIWLGSWTSAKLKLQKLSLPPCRCSRWRFNHSSVLIARSNLHYHQKHQKNSRWTFDAIYHRWISWQFCHLQSWKNEKTKINKTIVGGNS